MNWRNWMFGWTVIGLGLLAVSPGCAESDCRCTDLDSGTEGTPEADGGVEVPDDGGEAEPGDVEAAEGLDDGGGGEDGEDADGGPVGPGYDCQSCEDDSDCGPDYFCVQLAAGGGGVCLRSCDEELPDCPPRFDCVESRITPLPTAVCAPVGERCCVDADYDDYGSGVGCRGPDCDDGDPRVNPEEPEACDGADNDCDGTADEDNPGGGVVCVTGLPGACARGETSCVDGVLECRPVETGAPEACDGVDNDCNGWIDEDPATLRALTRPCYDGPSGTEGVGTCAAGLQTCAGGEYRTCVGQTLPATERCDGVDEDCDTVVDDGDPGGGIACTAPVPGICAAGETRCVGGVVTCVSTIAPGSQPELCDTLDNDCDGVVNNGFPDLNAVCFTGVGACRRAGLRICDPADPAGPPICDAPVVPPGVETCNYIDDDCDGTVDDGYIDAGGVYDQDTNCGACGIDCTSIFALPGAYGTCRVTGSAATCAMNCNSGFFDLNGVPGDGCEFQLDADAIYVSGEDWTSVDDAGCGLGPATTGGGRYACRTISYGISRATATGRNRVLVADALYVESVTLAAGRSLLGGYRADTWERHLTTTLTTIRAPAGAGHRKTITATGISSATTVEGFVIEGTSATTAGANSYAVYVNGGTSALTISNNTIYAGSGAPGSTGAAGTDGADGVAGTAGQNAFDTGSASCGTSRAGPPGGARTCGTTVVNGGAGGGVQCPPWRDTAPHSALAGGAGSGTGGGAGGARAYDGETDPYYSCNLCTLPLNNQTMTGGNGGAGANGSHGAAGAGASSAVGSVAANEWVGAGGGAGGGGTHGAGGGGGGAGGGGDGLVSILYGSCTDDLGATGGGGGSGGCAGTAGSGGGAGGGSFGIFVVNTASPPTLTGNTIYRGFGGAGGNGGRGGVGGTGGAGAAGGLMSTAPSSFCTGDGGHGGNGGHGGHGGGGGGGAGGVSYGIYVAGMSGYGAGTNTFPASGGGGAGGGGGPSLGNSGTAGVAGAGADTN